MCSYICVHAYSLVKVFFFYYLPKALVLNQSGLTPRKHLAVTADIFACHTEEGF